MHSVLFISKKLSEHAFAYTEESSFTFFLEKKK